MERRRSYQLRQNPAPPPKILLPEYRDDPLGFYRDHLDAELWRSVREERIRLAPQDVQDALRNVDACGQADILEALADPTVEHVAVVAAKGPGKTFALGRAPLWWVHTRDNAVCVVVSATGVQVSLQVFGHMERALLHGKTRFGVTLKHSPVPTYQIAPNHYVVGLSPAKPEGLQGWHAEALESGLGGPVLVIVDETSGIRDDILEATYGLLTNPGSKMVWSSNAKRATGALFEMFNPLAAILDDLTDETDEIESTDVDAEALRALPGLEERVAAGRTVLQRITAYDAPDWIIGDAWLRGRERDPMAKRGTPRMDDALFRHDVMGLFPTSDTKLLFPRPFLQVCANHRPRFGGLHMGVDLGRGGPDPCVALLCDNNLPVSFKRWSDASAKRDLMRSAHIIADLMDGWGVDPENVHIDATGLGWGVVDRLWEMGLQVDAVDFGSWNANEAAYAQHRDYWRHVLGRNYPKLKTRRQDLYWLMRRCMEEGYAGVPAVGAFGPLWEELSVIEGGLVSDAFWIAKKAAIEKILGHSPDWADAYACQFSRTNPMMVRLRRLQDDGVVDPTVLEQPGSGRLASGPKRPRSAKAARRRRAIMRR